MLKKRLFKESWVTKNLNALLFSVLGTFLFWLSIRHLPLDYTAKQWAVLGSMFIASLILYFYTFQIPPEGSKQSMDSAVYLACLFIFGTPSALALLFLSTLVFAFIERKITWWKHLTNFSLYTIMIFGAGTVFNRFGGRLGQLENSHLLSYVGALVIYFVLNVLCIGIYYYMADRSSIHRILKGYLRESAIVYLCILILSLVLTILIVNNGIAGLILFLGISIFLSHLFKKLFDMYLQLQERAIRDQRTGLFNHSYFESLLEMEIQYAHNEDTPLSLAMIDIDDFKRFNDHFGHLEGDKLLGLLGSILNEEATQAGVTASRYGGEEFTLLMPGYTEKEALVFVNHLRKRVNDTPFAGVEVLPHACLSFSAGISGYHIDIHDKSLLVLQADQALYDAKKQGKNIAYIYGSSMPLEQEIEIAQDVRDIEQLLNLFLYKDINTFKHSKRVYRYAMDVGMILKLDAGTHRQFALGALIHDIGKLEIPWETLNKKGKLTPDEWEVVKKHVNWGKEIAMTNDKFKELAPYIELHHERFDGKGYPNGYKGAEIPLLCRMLTIIDSFDAMTSERPYQATKSIQEAVEELRFCSGTQFDPDLTRLFIDYIEGKTGLTPVHAEAT
ncbi:diguanylate cyclase [Paenibacillus sp.]|jgi:diguanylate cyclase (GGDEF)-like protein|uniref:bifunctional diguanylate cyclase/phosphohydrolase n=1 Tax=Paenibacillus sp. TaxID=58172 RepID=UPI00281FF4A9|nr:diguanylate cyclase [Paenibacillus sp.]MDR0269077.1 diguanylate cyclase [Paenibacillus sp.]